MKPYGRHPTRTVGAIPCGRLAGHGGGNRRPPPRARRHERARRIDIFPAGDETVRASSDTNRKGAPLWAPGRGTGQGIVAHPHARRHERARRIDIFPAGDETVRVSSDTNRRGDPLWVPGGERGGATSPATTRAIHPHPLPVIPVTLSVIPVAHAVIPVKTGIPSYLFSRARRRQTPHTPPLKTQN